MKLEKYLKEKRSIGETNAEEIGRVCKKYIDMIRGSDYILGRYSFKESSSLKSNKIITTRKDRKPLDTPVDIHNMADDILKEKFGWRPRSESVFCIPKKPDTFINDAKAIFPIGNFKFIWSPTIKDFFISIYRHHRHIFGISSVSIEDKEKLMKELLSDFTDKNFKDALLSDNEIMIKCDKYYSVRADLLPYINRILKINWPLKNIFTYIKKLYGTELEGEN